MTVAVKKWGNSLALRIPKDIAKSLSVDENSKIDLEIVHDGVLLKPVHNSHLEDLVSQITKENLHSEVDSGASVGHEEW